MTRRVPYICPACVHYSPDNDLSDMMSIETCRAFPEGIPDAVLSGRIDHSEKIPEDNGLTFTLDDADELKKLLAMQYYDWINSPEGISAINRIEQGEE